MSVKYKMEFQNAQGYDCVLNFILDDAFYAGDPIPIYGGPRPFVLSEFNQDNDFFKAIRPQQATIEVLASINGVEVDDFITEDDDRQITVRFDFGPWTGYWYGILSQEDIQEQWIAQNHILTLRADEGFGVMKTVPLRDYDGNILLGTYTPYQLIQYASTETVRTFLNARVISNLFHTSMSSASKTTGLDQCTIDARTFEQTPGVFDDSYTVLEKINKAWNQTIFQYQGQWWIVRQEEQFLPKTSNLIGFVSNSPVLGQRASINTRYMIEVGAEEQVKPIMPEMLKTLNKPSKETLVRYDWENFAQIVCNETFKYGTFVETTGTAPNETWKYTVTNWTVQQGAIASSSPSTKLFQRQVKYVDNKLNDEYVMLEKDDSVPVWARSCNVYVNELDSIDIGFQVSLKAAGGTTIAALIFIVQLYGSDGTYWTLDDDGVWYQSNSVWSVNLKQWAQTWSTSANIGPDWYDQSVTGSVIPRSGYLNFLFINNNNGSTRDKIYYRNLTVDILPNLQKFRRRKVDGDYDSYTIDRTFKKNSDTEIHLSDSESPNYKGGIFESDGVTLTSGEWYRRTYPSESYPFKQHNAIARWFENRRYKNRLECNFFGLVWDRSGTDFPIGLINTINFVDDAPDKTFAIVNLREIDFMACTWTANLMEIWDENEDNTVQPSASDDHLNDYYYE